MSKNLIDYNALDQVINKKSYRLKDVKDRLEKVAFDIVRFKDEDKGADLWQIQSSDDGDYIVSLYEESKETIKTAASHSPWEVTSSGNYLYFHYKGDPITKVACADKGLSNDDARLMAPHLGKQLSENKKLVSLLLGQVGSDEARQEILNKYPELL